MRWALETERVVLISFIFCSQQYNEIVLRGPILEHSIIILTFKHIFNINLTAFFLILLFSAIFYVFERHLTKHACFQDNLKRTGAEWFVETKRFSKPEDVNRVHADRLTGWVLPIR